MYKGLVTNYEIICNTYFMSGEIKEFKKKKEKKKGNTNRDRGASEVLPLQIGEGAGNKF